ncbi:MAG: hypothetical protein R3E89_18830 [Thiolinea sp.]
MLQDRHAGRIQYRSAAATDAADLADLLDELGYPSGHLLVQTRIAALTAQQGHCVYVAVLMTR